MLENRVPLKVKGRTRAAIPTDVDGLFIYWCPISRSYAIAHHSGATLADGFPSVFRADCACDSIGDLADWTAPGVAFRDLPFRTFARIAYWICFDGGWLLCDVGQIIRPHNHAEAGA